jgi:hypothetical protein
MADSLVPLIECLGVRAMKRQDDPRQRNRPGFQGKVHVIRHEAVGVETKSESIPVVHQSSKVSLAIAVVPKDIALFVPARDDVIHRARKLQTRRARHQGTPEFNISPLSCCRERSDSAIQR